MSFYEDASLIVLADGAYDSGIKAFKPVLNDSDPSDPNYLVPSGVGDLTVDRNSEASFVGSNNLIQTAAANIPRFDYLNGSCPELLIEPQSTNLIANSNSFSSSDVTLTTNYSISPDGTQNATLAEKTTAGDDFINSIGTGTLTGSSDYTVSLFIKRSQGDIDFRIEQNISTEWGLSWNARFSLTSSGITINQENNCTAKVTSYFNDWYRVEVSLTTGALPVGAAPDYLIRLESGFGVGSGFEFWESQLENHPFATSLIKTEGFTVTRLADEITGAGDSNTFNSSEGVLFFEGSWSGLADVPASGSRLGLSDSTFNNRVSISFLPNTNQINYFLNNGGSTIVSETVNSINEDTVYKIAVKYSASEYKVYLGGSQIVNLSLNASTSSINDFSFDSVAGSNKFYGRVKQILVFNEALSDAELTTLTS